MSQSNQTPSLFKKLLNFPGNSIAFVVEHVEQSGAVEACWAHNPEVRGSKPRSANHSFLDFVLLNNHIPADNFKVCK